MNSKTGDEALKQRVIELEKELAKYRKIEAEQAIPEALRGSEEKFRAIFENADDVIVYMNTDGKIIDINNKVEAVFGYKREDIIGKNFTDFKAVGAKELKKTIKRLESLISGEQAGMLEHRVFRKDGSVVYVEANAQPVKTNGRVSAIMAIIRDITGRKKAEEALRASEAKYHMLFDNSPLGIMHWDKNGIAISCNNHMSTMLGATPEQIIGYNVCNYKKDPKVKTHIFKALDGELCTFESEHIRRPDNKKTILRATYGPVYSSDHKIDGCIGIVQDISDQKKAELELIESEEKFKMIFENANDVIVYVRPDGIVIDANEKITEFGYTREEVIGRNFAEFEIFQPAELGRSLDYLDNTLSGNQQPAMEFEILRKDKTRLFVEVNSQLIQKNGEIKGIINIIRDITKRKKTMDALRMSEERYRDIVENINDVLYTVTEDGIFTYISPSVEHLTGFAPSEIIGSYFGDFIYHEDFQNLKESMRDVLAGNTRSSEGRYVKKSGETGWIYFSSKPVLVNGKIFGIHGVITEISARKKAEKEQEKLEAQLQYAKKMESIGTLSGGIAHNFNNLLMAIQGNISIMLMDASPDSPYYHEMKSIEQCVESGATLTRQLLGFARGGKYSVAAINLNDIVKSTSSLFGYTSKEITIHEDYQTDIWTVEADRSQLEQVLVNVYVNARQAMHGGGELYLKTENLILDNRYNKPYKIKYGRYVRISITDTGVGMDKETRQKIFEPFFTTKDVGQGTGLGLASAFGIIKNHGGIINCYSELGNGTTIRIYLPASEKEIKKEADMPNDIIKGTETILVVDDEPAIIQVAELMLKELGYNVITAEGGRKAVETFNDNKGKIDLVILDIIMPDMNGKDVYVALKKIAPGVKVIASSGYSMTKQVAALLEQGCNSFLQKPFSLNKLSQEIRKVFDET